MSDFELSLRAHMVACPGPCQSCAGGVTQEGKPCRNKGDAGQHCGDAHDMQWAGLGSAPRLGARQVAAVLERVAHALRTTGRAGSALRMRSVQRRAGFAAAEPIAGTAARRRLAAAPGGCARAEARGARASSQTMRSLALANAGSTLGMVARSYA